jgi:tetratricopeptide (TPR) repeat protein
VNPRRFIRFPARAACSLLVALAWPALAAEEDLGSLVNQTLAAMKEENWAQGLALSEQAVARFGRGDPLQEYGPQFGAIHYRKGLCEMKLGKWAEAMASFGTCYRDFPNKEAGGNPFEKMALLKWGEAAMGAGDWELAVTRFRKFLAERDPARDEFPQGAFYVGLAVCHYRLGHIPEGNENLEIAIRNKELFPTPDSGIMAGFQALVSSAILRRDEQALLDFIGKNRGGLTIEPHAMQRYATVFLKLAGDATTAEMDRAATAIYQFVPSTETAIDDTRARLKSIGPLRELDLGSSLLVRKDLEEQLAALEAAERGGNSSEVVTLGATALLHRKLGNLRGALAAYRQLEALRKDSAAVRKRAAAPSPAGSAPAAEAADSEAPALLIGKDGACRKVRLVSANGSAVRYRDEGAPEIRETRVSDWAAIHVSEPHGLSAAMDLYQARKYREAREGFAAVKARFMPILPLEDSPAALAAFYEMECLRKLGDLDGLAAALRSSGALPLSRETQLRQIELHPLWDAVRMKQWDRLDVLATDRENQCLPGDQRAQIAYCHGLALEGLNRQREALDRYQTAITADAGASEEIARQAALRVLAIHLADPAVRAAMGSGEATKHADLMEAAAVARWFELSLGAGMPLPAEYRDFLKHEATAGG